FAFVVYYNLLNLGQTWVGTSRLGLGEFLLALHGGALLLGLAWLAKRNFNWQRRGRRAAAPSPQDRPS
ncbi:MAG: LPS export ABC transporter permease LptF, partial [Gammaproteobacteria bacterium]|nr:LPS export ABC transporter permease LptF [Gammaproteobacteria bacterium]